MTRLARRAPASGFAAVAALLALAVTSGCYEGYAGAPPLRLWSDDLAYQVFVAPAPPIARENAEFRVVIRDKHSGQAIEGGEGRIFATSHDGISAWDGLTPGKQPGTYTAKLNFITAGDWPMGIQFRRDSTKPIQRLDWVQAVVVPTDETPKK